MADPAERARRRERYAEGVAEADAALGLLLEGLPSRLPGPTVRIVAGDHGEALDEHLGARGYAFDHGEFLDEDVVCVPLVLAGPGVEAGRSPAPASLADLHATLLAIAGVPAGSGHDLRGPSGAERVAVERRRLGGDASPLARLHAAAAFDASRGAIVGEAGAAPGDLAPAAGDPAERALLELASRHARAAADAPAREADSAALAEALRALGYAE